jgi:hypothetical protein
MNEFKGFFFFDLKNIAPVRPEPFTLFRIKSAIAFTPELVEGSYAANLKDQSE